MKGETVMKTRTKVRAGSIILNHNSMVRREETPAANVKETLVRDTGGLKEKTRLKAGLKTV
jgi:hypothetical protein